MNRKGNCYDNAPIGSFWGALKSEFLIHIILATKMDAKAAVVDYIEVFDHLIRAHKKLNNSTARQFAQM